MQLQIFTVDAFSSRPFDGNPAAVVPLTEELDGETLQKIACEMNLSETAYIRPLEATCADWTHARQYSLRWFTPVKEIPLCGHATLASAHAIFDCLKSKKTEIEFHTLSGILTVQKEGDNKLSMNFPANPPHVLDSRQSQLLKPLVEAATTDLKDTIKDVRLCQKNKYLLIRLDDTVTRSQLESLRPNYSEMARVHDGSLVMGVIVTTVGDAHRGGTSQYNVFSRFFAPLYGVNEDPVTGSAHTVLGPYWAKELGITRLSCRQCCQRGGDVTVTVLDNGRVDLKGEAVTVIKGHINI